MKKEEILQLFQQFEAVASELEGVECWSARELQKLLGYTKWENFEKVIKKAKDACNNAGEDAYNHFPDIRKTIPMPKGAEKEIERLTLLVTEKRIMLNSIEETFSPKEDEINSMLIANKVVSEEFTRKITNLKNII